MSTNIPTNPNKDIVKESNEINDNAIPQKNKTNVSCIETNNNELEKKKFNPEVFSKFINNVKNLCKSEQDKFKELTAHEKYSKFKIFITEFKAKKEREYINRLNDIEKQDLMKKEKEISDFIIYLENKIKINKKNINNNDLSCQDILKIKNFASTNYGFTKNAIRLKFYKYLFFIDDNNPIYPNRDKITSKFNKSIKFLYKDHKEENKKYKKIFNLYLKETINYSSPIDPTKTIKESSGNKNNNHLNDIQNNAIYTSIFHNLKPIKYENIIEVDVKRTIYNSIFNQTDYEKVMLDYLKEKITQKIKNFFSLDDNLKYYQGFHDIAIFIYILILNKNENLNEENYEEDEYNDDILFYELLQRIAEFYVKDYLAETNVCSYNIKGECISSTKSAFNFQNINSIVNDIEEKIDDKIFNLIQNKSDFPSPIYTLPWILTYFTHDIKNSNVIYRLLDYVLFEHPASIFYIAANVK